MTRSMYRSSSRREGITSRVVRSWMEALGTAVFTKASEITVDMALKDSVDSFPPE